jgi:hypothetical protein
VAAQIAALFKLPARISLVVNGGVIELVDQQRFQTAIVVMETCTVELQHAEVASVDPTESKGMITARAMVRGFTVSCMNASSTAAIKNLAVKSLAIESKSRIGRVSDGAGEGWTIKAVDVSSAVEAIHVVHDLGDFGVNGWVGLVSAYVQPSNIQGQDQDQDQHRRLHLPTAATEVEGGTSLGTGSRTKLIHLMEQLPGGRTAKQQPGIDMTMKVAVTDAVVCVVGIQDRDTHRLHANNCEDIVVQIGTASMSVGRASNARGAVVHFEVGELTGGVGGPDQHGPHQTIEPNDGVSLERLTVKVLIDPSELPALLQEEDIHQRRRVRDMDVNVVVVGLQLSTTLRLVRVMGHLKQKLPQSYGAGTSSSPGATGTPTDHGDLPFPPSAFPSESSYDRELSIDGQIQALNLAILMVGDPDQAGMPAVQMSVDSWTGSLTRAQSPRKSKRPDQEDRRPFRVQTELMSAAVRTRLAVANVVPGTSDSGIRSLLHSMDSEIMFAPSINLKVDASTFPGTTTPGSILCDFTVPELRIRWQLVSHVTAFSCAQMIQRTLSEGGNEAMDAREDTGGTAVESAIDAAAASSASKTAVFCSVDIGVTRIHITAPPTKIVCATPGVGDPVESSPVTTIVLKVTTTKAHVRKQWWRIDPNDCQDEVMLSCALIDGKIEDKDILLLRQVMVRQILTYDEEADIAPLLELCANPPHVDTTRLEGGWWFDPVEEIPDHTMFVDIHQLRLMLPHGPNLGMYLEQLQNTAKAVKAIHTAPVSSPSAATSKPLADIVSLRLRSVEFCMEDDPFEVQLGQNYRLQAEEMREQNNRERLLRSKIETIGEEHPNAELDPAWVAGMFETLGVASSSAYVQRARTLLQSTHPAPMLFAVNADEFRLTFVPDPHVVGPNGLAATIKAVNKEASHPDPMPTATFSFARRMGVSCRELKVTLRDYGNPLLHAHNLNVNGLLLLQSVVPVPAVELMCRRLVYLEGATEPVLRDGAPMKVYHALNLKVETMHHSWGPCVEPVLQQLAINFDKLLTRGLLLPPPSGVWLPFYDKLRQMRHGPIYVHAKQWTIAILCSLDPHTEEDRIEIAIDQLVARWYHGKLVLHGDANVIVFPLTQFYACPVLSLKGVDVNVDIEWLCAKGPDAAECHHVDDMNDFKSLGYNMILNMRIQKDASSSSRAVCLLYANVLTWLSRSYREVFTVARPKVKSGRLWRRFDSPRQKSLGDHMRNMKLDVSLPRTTLLYFNGFDRSRGVHITSSELAFKAQFDQPPEPELGYAKRASSGSAASTGSAGSAGTHRNKERVCTAVNCEIAAVRATALKYASNKQCRAGAGAGDAASGESDSESDDDDEQHNEHLNVDFLITDIGKAADEHSSRGTAVGCTKELLCTATLVTVRRDHHRPDLRVRHTVTSPTSSDNGHFFPPNTPMSPPPTPFTPFRQNSSAGYPLLDDDNDDNVLDNEFLYVVDIETFAFVLTTFTADVFWSLWEKFKERGDLKYDLSPEAVFIDAGTKDLGSSKASNKSGAHQSSMLDKLLADANTNFMGASILRTPVQNRERKQINMDDQDILEHYARYRFSRPQIFFRGPETNMQLTMTIASMAVDLRRHKLVWTKGRLECKESFVYNLDQMQWFAGPCLPSGYQWLPPDCAAADPDAECPKNINCISPSASMRYITVLHFYDKAVAQMHEPSAVSQDIKSTLSKTNLHIDSYDYVFRKMVVETNPTEYAGFADVFTNLIKEDFPLEESNVTEQQELDTLMFKASLDASASGKSGAELAVAQKDALELQHAVRALKQGNDQLERSILANATDNKAGIEESESEAALRISLENDWSRNAMLFRKARRNLKIRIKALLELRWGQQRGGNEVVRWNARNRSAVFDQLRFIMLTSERSPLCEVRLNGFKWEGNEDNRATQSGTVEYGVQDIEMIDICPSDVAGGKANILSNSGQRIPMISRYRTRGTQPSKHELPMLRIFDKEASPVGGIPVTEHFEVNLTPLSVAFSKYHIDNISDFFSLEPEKVAEMAAAAAAADEVSGHSRTVSAGFEKGHRRTGSDSPSLQRSATVGARARAATMGGVRPGRAAHKDADGVGDSLLDSSDGGAELSEDGRKGHRRSGSDEPLGHRRTPSNEASSSPVREHRGSASSIDLQLDDKTHRRTGSGGLRRSATLGARPPGRPAIARKGSRTEEDHHASPFNDANGVVGVLSDVAADKGPVHDGTSSPSRSHRGVALAVVVHPEPNNTSLVGGAVEAVDESNELGVGKFGSAEKIHRRTGSNSPVVLRRGALPSNNLAPEVRANRRSSLSGGDLSELKAVSSKVQFATLDAPTPAPMLQRKPSVYKPRTQALATIEAQVADMKTRAKSSTSFVYVKVPSFLVCVTYKGGGVVTDLNSLVVTLPMLEYHNRTFSWPDLLTQIRSDCSGHVYSALIKGKLLGMNTGDQGLGGEVPPALAAITQAMEDASPAALKAREAVLFGSEKEMEKKKKKMEKAEKKMEKKKEKASEKAKPAKPSTLLGGLRRVFHRGGASTTEEPPQ